MCFEPTNNVDKNYISDSFKKPYTDNYEHHTISPRENHCTSSIPEKKQAYFQFQNVPDTDVNQMISSLRFSGPVCCSICGRQVYLVSMETRGQDTFITISVIVAVKLTGCDTNEK